MDRRLRDNSTNFPRSQFDGILDRELDKGTGHSQIKINRPTFLSSLGDTDLKNKAKTGAGLVWKKRAPRSGLAPPRSRLPPIRSNPNFMLTVTLIAATMASPVEPDKEEKVSIPRGGNDEGLMNLTRKLIGIRS